MPKTTFQRVIFVVIGVLLMATITACYNKYLVYGDFSTKFWREVLIAFCQKAPIAFVLQYFLLQKFAEKQAAKYPTDNKILYLCIRTGFTVLTMCPIMSLYSNLILRFQLHWSMGQLFANWIPKLCANWIFAFFVQVFVAGPLNRLIFRMIFKNNGRVSAKSTCKKPIYSDKD